MINEIDFKKLMQEEPEFKNYCQDVFIAAWTATKVGRQMLEALNSFYMAGLTQEQAVKLLVNNMRSQEGKQ